MSQIERARLSGRAERVNKLEAEIARKPLPAVVAYLWRIFLRLSARRASGMSLGAISWTDIDAFCRLTRTPLAPWEIEIIEDLDAAYLRERARALSAPDPTPEPEASP